MLPSLLDVTGLLQLPVRCLRRGWTGGRLGAAGGCRPPRSDVQPPAWRGGRFQKAPRSPAGTARLYLSQHVQAYMAAPLLGFGLVSFAGLVSTVVSTGWAGRLLTPDGRMLVQMSLVRISFFKI